MIIQKRISNHAIAVSKWYGLAWEEDFGHVKVLYPVPLNLVLRWGRDVWWWLRTWDGDRCWYRYSDLDTHIQGRLNREYRRGKDHGRFEVMQALSTMDLPTQERILQHLQQVSEAK